MSLIRCKSHCVVMNKSRQMVSICYQISYRMSTVRLKEESILSSFSFCFFAFMSVSTEEKYFNEPYLT